MPWIVNIDTGELEFRESVSGGGGITQIDADSGSATPVAGVVNIIGGEGIDTSASGNSVTISGEDATAGATSGAANKGIASFNSTQFTVSSGYVSLSSGGMSIDEILTDSGAPSVVPNVSGQINFIGGEGIDVTGQGPGNTVTIAGEDASTTNKGIASFDSVDFTVINGNVSLAGAGAGQTITGDTGGALTPTSGNWNILGQQAGTTAVMDTIGLGSTLSVENRSWLTSLVVDPSSTAGIRGTFTTIAAALTAASSGQTIFVRDGTYTENLTLKAGVNITSFTGANRTPNAQIVGKLTATFTGTCTISNLSLKTNGDNAFTITGANATNVFFSNCTFLSQDATAILLNNANCNVIMRNCISQIAAVGIAFFTVTSGTLTIEELFSNSQSVSSTANTIAAGTLDISYCKLFTPITTSGTSGLTFRHSVIDNSLTNTTALTVGGSGTNLTAFSEFISGTATAVSVGATLTMEGDCTVRSSNTNAIAGAGTLIYAPISFASTSSNISTTTQTIRNFGPSATIGSSNSGNTNTLTVTNASNTATSTAAIVASVAGATAADAVYQSVVSGVTTWTWGVDNSVTSPTVDPFVIAQGTALGTNNIMSVATSGEINYPLQSAFLATSSLQSNVTGDGTVYTVTYTTEVFDQNNDFDATSTFTAPVTGRYLLSHNIVWNGLTAAHTTGASTLVTSNRNYSFAGNYANIRNAGNGCQLNVSILADMDAADTAIIAVVVSGGTKVANVGAASVFSGYLAC